MNYERAKKYAQTDANQQVQPHFVAEKSGRYICDPLWAQPDAEAEGYTVLETVYPEFDGDSAAYCAGYALGRSWFGAYALIQEQAPEALRNFHNATLAPHRGEWGPEIVQAIIAALREFMQRRGLGDGVSETRARMARFEPGMNPWDYALGFFSARARAEKEYREDKTL